MAATGIFRMPRPERRRALRLGYVNGVLWSVGNGLTTGPLMIYLALGLGARPRMLGVILTLPALVGLLRICAPMVIVRLGGVKRASLVSLLTSYVFMLALP